VALWLDNLFFPSLLKSWIFHLSSLIIGIPILLIVFQISKLLAELLHIIVEKEIFHD